MNMPGFTAENSLFRRSGKYRLASDTSVSGLSSGSSMVQSAFSLTDPAPEFEFPPPDCEPCQCRWSTLTGVSCTRRCFHDIPDPYTGGVHKITYYRTCSPFSG